MVLQLDPRHPLVWRTPTTVQLGVDDVRVVADLTPAHEHLLYAVRRGVPRYTLNVIGEQQGLTDSDVDAFLDLLSPAMRGPRPGRTPLRVAIEGSGDTADAVSWAVETPESGGAPDIAVLIAHFVVDPAQSVRWLSRDIPHLPVVFSDATARVGPIIVGGQGPCLHCLDRERADRDPSWTAIETQLLGTTSLLDSGEFARDVATVVTRMLHEFDRAGRRLSTALSITVSPKAPQQLTVHRPHPECGCRSLGETASAPADDAGRLQTRSG